MTYSYLLSVPLLMIYAIGFSVIKYNYGFTIIPGDGIMPTPYQSWSRTAQNAVFPLYLSYSIAWGLEMVTHLEGARSSVIPVYRSTTLATELCFWLFLINSGSVHRDWFRSPYFKTWAVGSCIAVFAMPLVTTFTREDVYKCEGIHISGRKSRKSLVNDLVPAHLVDLSLFPCESRTDLVVWPGCFHVITLPAQKQHDVDINTLVRLTKFHELNCIRVVFRFMFTVPLVILGIDGVRPHQHINDKMLSTDLLAIIAGIGLVVSSGLTLVIFFPRSIEGEMALRDQQRSRRKQRAQRNLSRWDVAHMMQGGDAQSSTNITPSKADLEQLNGLSFGTLPNASLSLAGLPAYDVVASRGNDRLPSMKATLEDTDHLGGSISLQPNRRNQAGDVEMGAVLTVSEVELIRAQSTRDKGIWRPTVSRWQQQI
ncbi:hypothetical protein J3R83DRAFT_2396 [Lanmaoa asiatica]|nr:hypothetical protein J3R83DRAFT_2396 [Lanmaoa asiatica]